MKSTKTVVLALYGGVCHYCAVAAATTVDHIVPRSAGGPTRRWNLTPSCSPCNTRKAARRAVCGCFRCVRAERVFAGQPLTARRRGRRARAA